MVNRVFPSLTPPPGTRLRFFVGHRVHLSHFSAFDARRFSLDSADCHYVQLTRAVPFSEQRCAPEIAEKKGVVVELKTESLRH